MCKKLEVFPKYARLKHEKILFTGYFYEYASKVYAKVTQIQKLLKSEIFLVVFQKIKFTFKINRNYSLKMTVYFLKYVLKLEA